MGDREENRINRLLLNLWDSGNANDNARAQIEKFKLKIKYKHIMIQLNWEKGLAETLMLLRSIEYLFIK